MNTANKIEDRSMADVVDMANKLQAIIDSRDEEKIDEVSKVIGEEWLVAQGFHYVALGLCYWASAYTTAMAIKEVARISGASNSTEINWTCWKVPGVRRDDYPIRKGAINIDGAVIVRKQRDGVDVIFD